MPVPVGVVSPGMNNKPGYSKTLLMDRNPSLLRLSKWALVLFQLLALTQLHAQSPVASFVVSQTSGCSPLQVQFTNTSQNASSFFWDFGNGNTSTAINPVNVYLTPGNFTVKLVAYNAAGTADSIIRNGYIQTISPPSVNFTASVTTACLGGTPISFTNQSTGYDALLWDFGDGNTSAAVNPVHQYTASGTFTVTLIAYNNSAGCSVPLTKTGYITILSKPAATLTASATSVCNANTPISFQTSAPSAVNWLWNFGNGSTSTQPTPSHIYGTPGVYTVSLITTNSMGCTDTVTMPNFITVLSNPVPVINTTQPLTGCAPVTTTFTSSTPGITGYLWNFGDSTANSMLSSVPHQYPNPGTYTVTLTATYANGCSNTATATVQSFPKPTVTFGISNSQGCAPHTPVFTNTTNGPGYTYLWDFGDGSTSTQQHPTHTYTATGTYFPLLTVTDANGCSRQQGTITNVVVTAVSAVFTADAVTGCNPHTVNFTHPGGGVFTYNWNFGNGVTSNLQSPSYTYTSNGSYTVTLTVSNNGGCSHTYTLPQNIQVSNGTNNFTPAPPVTACGPFTINLYDNSPNTSGWLWDFGDGTTSNVQNPVHTYTTSGTYVVTLQTTSSGSACSQYISPYATYIINTGEAYFTVSQNLCPPFTATFTDLSVNAVSWLWDFGDGTTSTQQHPVHVYANPGSYNVSLTITTAQGCTYTMYHNYAVTFIPLFANATAITTDSILPLTVNFFANSSGATMWYWDFGDGNSSTQMNPVHTYTTPGPYNISLTISNPQCTLTIDYPAVTFGNGAVLSGSGGDSIQVPPPVFSCIPYEMNFSNPVQNTVSWLWDFGDGNTSTVENPHHIYTDPGTFTVSLITWDANGNTDTVDFPSPFYLTGATADFNIVHANNCTGSTVYMQNNSSNAISYFWDFGDGNTSTDPSPVHSYTTTGVNYIVSLTVTDTLGCTDFMARSYYASASMPLSTNTRRGCAGDTITFSSGAISFATYLWNFGDGTTSTLPHPIHVYPDSGQYQVQLTVTDSLGCTITWTLPYNVRISKPIANFTSQMGVSGCLAVRHQFTNLSTGADSYLWDFGNGMFSSQVNPMHAFQGAGYHNVTLTAYRDGCSSAYTSLQHVYVPSLTANFTYTQSSECYPVTATYTDASTDAVSWLWDFGDGTSSTQQNPVHVFNTKPQGAVTLTVTSYTGCIQTINKPNISAMNVRVSLWDTVGCTPFLLTISDSSDLVASWLWDFGDGNTSAVGAASHLYTSNGIWPVSVTATAPSGCTQVINPVATIKTSGPVAGFSQSTIVSCAPTIVNFTDFSAGAQLWNWDFGNGNHSTLQHPTHIYNQPGNYTVTLVVSDSTGCADTLIIPDMVHITGSVAGFSVSSTSGCSPFEVHFADSSISAFSWLWNFGDGTTSTDPNPVHTYTSPGSYTVTLVTHDTTGCQSIYSHPVPFTVQAQPAAQFQIPVNSGCAPFALPVINNSTGATSWHWDFGDGNTSSAQAPNHIYTQPGNYLVSLIAFNGQGCSDTMTASVPVNVIETPVASFTVSAATGCAPATITFNNLTSGSDSTTTWLWNFGNGSTSTLASPSFTYTSAGVYNITLTATNSQMCSNSMLQNAALILSDNNPLPPVLMKSVSVTGPTNIEVTWGNLPLQGLQAYNLYRYNDVTSVFDLIYTDTNPSNSSLNVTSSHVDTGVNTSNKVYTYVTQAVNLCAISTPINQLNPHSSINLEAVKIGAFAELSWNFYDGCPVAGYHIYRQDNLSGSFMLIGMTGATENSFTDSTVYCESTVAYRVKAIDICGEGYEAWSDVEILQMPGTIVNQKVDMVRSTVIDDRYVFTEWAPPSVAPNLVNGFDLYRSTDNINFSLVATVPATQTYYEDFNTRVKEQNYFYRVKLNNSCGLETSNGLESSSILLVGIINQDNDSQLRWSPYKNWDTGVDYYVIEKQDAFGVWQTIKVVAGNVHNYLDRD
jgi:PKD repeat protein